jgi:TonB family protein
MVLTSLVLAAGLLTCGDLGAPDLSAVPGKEARVMLERRQTSLDRVFKMLAPTGRFRATFTGFTPKVDVAFVDRSLGEVLRELAARHGLAYRWVAPDLLEVRGPVLPGLDGVSEPRPRDQAAAVFPKEARAAGGRVVLGAVVCEDGRVGALHVIEAPPEIVFREAAVRAVSGWTYTPAVRAGKAVPAYTTVTVDFVRPP